MIVGFQGIIMRTFGVFLLIVSIFIVIYALNMDITVSTAYGRVNNIGLISNRQTYLIIAGALFIGSFILIALGRSTVSSNDFRKCPFCAEEIKKDAIKCKHCQSDIGPTNLDNNLKTDNKELENKEVINKKLSLFFMIAVLLLVGLMFVL